MALMKIRSLRKRGQRKGYLDGQMLLAMPGMVDARFARSVIYICAHSSEGAMGIVVNRKSRRVTFQDLLEQLEITFDGEAIRLPTGCGAVPVLRGGPVETQRGFVLHSPDYEGDNSTLAIDAEVSMTATIDILRDIANGSGPARALLALGYAGWAAGQLEKEMQQNGWLSFPADAEIVFDGDFDGKYARALAKIGVDPARLVAEAGHA